MILGIFGVELHYKGIGDWEIPCPWHSVIANQYRKSCCVTALMRGQARHQNSIWILSCGDYIETGDFELKYEAHCGFVTQLRS